MRKEEIIKKIGKKRWNAFCKFMEGQTVSCKDGIIDYYACDVDNFLNKPEKRFFD